MLVLILAATGTALATGLGAIPVALLGDRVRAWRPALVGFAAGVMTVAAIVGLLQPALAEGSWTDAALGGLGGVGFLLGARALLGSERASHGRFSGPRLRTSVLVFAVLLVHSLPEGFAIGTAYASDTAGLSLFVILAIAIQNVPEGTSVAIPMAAAGVSGRKQIWAAVGTSAPQPLGAVVSYLLVEEIEGLLPISFGFAAGAMLALVMFELLPQSVGENRRHALPAIAAGGLLMWALGMALSV